MPFEASVHVGQEHTAAREADEKLLYQRG
jgi:hypothetical protein